MNRIVKVEVYFGFICLRCLPDKRQLGQTLTLLHVEDVGFSSDPLAERPTVKGTAI